MPTRMRSHHHRQENSSPGGKRTRFPGPELPEDIWCHIHSLMPMRDAAHAACLSRAFLRSWRCHPNLVFDRKTLGCRFRTVWDFESKVDDIVKKHSGIGVKTFSLEWHYGINAKACSYLDSWLQMANAPGIEELTLNTYSIYSRGTEYNFPCSLLSDDGRGSSIRYLRLAGCSFRPTVELGCSLRSLTTLNLCDVRITRDQLGCLLSGCAALERLELRRCSEITSLKIPSLLKHLSHLQVFGCRRLRMIENEAPNICSFQFWGLQVQLCLGQLLQLKDLELCCTSTTTVCYARQELPSVAPNLETLTIRSYHQMVSTAMLPSRLLHLKYLSIYLSGDYDYFSLVSFLDASPSLETFILNVPSWEDLAEDSVYREPLHLRRMPAYHHDKLRTVKISRFFHAKSLVELTRHILENAPSLESLTLDTTHGVLWCSTSKFGACYPLRTPLEPHKAALAIRTYIEEKVPSTVVFNVVEPCSRCHAI